MPASQEDRKFYIRAPSLDYPREGPIKIGNVITDMFLPQDPIARFSPMPAIIDGARLSEGSRERSNNGSTGLDISTKLYAAFGSQARAKYNEDVKIVYDFDEVDTLMLERNPRSTEMNALRSADPEVQAALKRGPVYVVTGLKLARGLRYSTKRSTEQESGLGAQAKVTGELSITANLDRNSGTGNTESYTVLGDVILAYRLHIVKKEGWKWRGEAALETKTYWPGNAGFLSREEIKEEAEVEANALSVQDLKFFAEEEEYGHIESIDVEDLDEAWLMVFVED